MCPAFVIANVWYVFSLFVFVSRLARLAWPQGWQEPATATTNNQQRGQSWLFRLRVASLVPVSAKQLVRVADSDASSNGPITSVISSRRFYLHTRTLLDLYSIHGHSIHKQQWHMHIDKQISTSYNALSILELEASFFFFVHSGAWCSFYKLQRYKVCLMLDMTTRENILTNIHCIGGVYLGLDKESHRKEIDWSREACACPTIGLRGEKNWSEQSHPNWK